MTYRPEFRCNHCGQTKAADVFGSEGVFVPCQCEQGRKAREQAYYAEMERRKQARSAAKKRGNRR